MVYIYGIYIYIYMNIYIYIYIYEYIYIYIYGYISMDISMVDAVAILFSSLTSCAIPVTGRTRDSGEVTELHGDILGRHT